MRDIFWIAVSFALIAIAASMWFWITAPSYAGTVRCGIASFYGSESGSTTATGHHFNPEGLTAAMPSRSMLGKRVRVTYRGRSVVVLVDDIGPNRRLHRIIDLSRGTARRLGLSGIGRVCVEIVGSQKPAAL